MSDRKPLPPIPNHPKACTYWRHVDDASKLYFVYFVAYQESDLSFQVVYGSMPDGPIWIRPVDNFLARFRLDDLNL